MAGGGEGLSLKPYRSAFQTSVFVFQLKEKIETFLDVWYFKASLRGEKQNQYFSYVLLANYVPSIRYFNVWLIYRFCKFYLVWRVGYVSFWHFFHFFLLHKNKIFKKTGSRNYVYGSQSAGKCKKSSILKQKRRRGRQMRR